MIFLFSRPTLGARYSQLVELEHSPGFAKIEAALPAAGFSFVFLLMNGGILFPAAVPCTLFIMRQLIQDRSCLFFLSLQRVTIPVFHFSHSFDLSNLFYYTQITYTPS